MKLKKGSIRDINSIKNYENDLKIGIGGGGIENQILTGKVCRKNKFIFGTKRFCATILLL